MKNEMSFEEAMILLDDTVKKLEGGNLSLDESIVAFEKSVALVKLCNQKLELAEQKVRILAEGADGTTIDLPFDVSDEN